MEGIKIQRKKFVAGNLAITLPISTNAKGLPIGSLFAACFGGEENLLHLAHELEKAQPSTNRRPEMSGHKI